MTPYSRYDSERVFVVSDLHLGGTEPYMMSRPDYLANFVRSLPARARENENLELVIAGDFVDFLAVPPFAAFTQDPSEACDKLRNVTDHPPFDVVFDALREFSAHHRLTVLIGNHDVEFGLPDVQRSFLGRLDVDAHHLLFIDDGRAYRKGRALIEHGNRYDKPNWNDWDALRAIASAQSRGEQDPFDLVASVGSHIVERVVNELKRDYPFVDLIQPEGVVQVLLLHEFESRIRSVLAFAGRHLRDFPLLLEAGRQRATTRSGARPNVSRNIAAGADPSVDTDLQSTFGEAYATLMNPPRDVADGLWPPIPSKGREHGLAALLRRGEPIPPERLSRIRRALRAVNHDASLDPLPLDALALAAKDMVDRKVCDVVVMGHTHQARRYCWTEQKDLPSYINIGAWADVVRVPKSALAGDDDALVQFLRSLFDRTRQSQPTYADLCISHSGQVSHARLETFTP